MCAAILAFLSLSAGDLYPNQSYMVTASIYCTGPISTTARLELPTSGFALAGESIIPIELDQDKPATINWRIAVKNDAPRNTLIPIKLFINNELKASTTTLVRCSSALDAMCKHYYYLPLLNLFH